jgi:hypothetical protein
MEQFLVKYFEKPNLILDLQKRFNYVMVAPAIIRVTQMLSLVQAVLLPHLLKQETLNKKDFENYFVFAFAWSFGGLFETEDR